MSVSSAIASLGRTHTALGLSGDLTPRIFDIRPGRPLDEPFLSVLREEAPHLQSSVLAAGEVSRVNNSSSKSHQDNVPQVPARVALCESFYPTEKSTLSLSVRRENILEELMEGYVPFLDAVLRSSNEASPPGVLLCNAATMSLFAVGLESGIVVDLGHTQSTVCAVRQGVPSTKTWGSCPVTGLELSEALCEFNGTKQGKLNKQGMDNEKADMLSKKGLQADPYHEFRENYHYMKTKLRITPLDHSVCQIKIPKQALSLTSVLPDGAEINIPVKETSVSEVGLSDTFSSVDEKWKKALPELYFDLNRVPGRNYSAGQRLTDVIHNVVRSLDCDGYSDLVLTGGCASIPHMYERVLQECMLRNVSVSFPSHLCRIPVENQLLPFVGLSIVSSHAIPSLYITPAEYAEHGPSLVHSRCV